MLYDFKNKIWRDSDEAIYRIVEYFSFVGQLADFLYKIRVYAEFFSILVVFSILFCNNCSRGITVLG